MPEVGPIRLIHRYLLGEETANRGDWAEGNQFLGSAMVFSSQRVAMAAIQEASGGGVFTDYLVRLGIAPDCLALDTGSEFLGATHIL